MKSRRIAALAFAFLTLLLATPALANPRGENATGQINFVLPTLQRALGVLTLTREPAMPIVSSSWSFVGTVDGVPATGRGVAKEVWTSDTTGTIELTTIEQWNSSLPRPSAGSRVSFRQVGNVLNLGDPPFTIAMDLSQPLKPPVEGNSVQFNLTNVGATPSVIQDLPNTGNPTPILPWAVALIGALLLAIGLKLPTTSGHNA